MNDFARRVIMDRLAGDRRPNRDRRRRDNRDQEDQRGYDERDTDYEMDEDIDERRGRRRNRRDRMDDERDMSDYHHNKPEMRLRKSDILEWKRNLENSDGTTGEHYKIDEIMAVAKKFGLKFDGYNEKELCILVNVIYSDIGHILRHYMDQSMELKFCVDVAQAIFDDPDGPEGFEKLALYYYCIVCYGQL